MLLENIYYSIDSIKFLLQDQITLEKSPAYFVTHVVPERMKSMDPNLKILLIVRDPVTRLVSDFAQMTSNRARRTSVNLGFKTLKNSKKELELNTNGSVKVVSKATESFKKLKEMVLNETHPSSIASSKIRTFEEMVLNSDGSVNLNYKAIQIGIYASYFPRWLRTFDRDQIHIVDGDHFVADPHSEVVKVEDFLGIGRAVPRSSFHFNATKGFFCGGAKCLRPSKGRRHPAVAEATLRALRAFYAPHNARFSRQAGLEFDWPH